MTTELTMEIRVRRGWRWWLVERVPLFVLRRLPVALCEKLLTWALRGVAWKVGRGTKWEAVDPNATVKLGGAP